ncbi:uncharacterized protein LOC129294419 isoform X3 [Prosopis cineraria]|uniref:uncharacterized protein LOC129294419 isoform X3 n=1 Tax=Prosopis cineraria TaxID=364024 RepID=UPI00240EED63|nr:uncharacterized protein LOC129294419 isoform X3 [Prosopis cineraria]
MIASSMELIQQFSLPIARSVRPSLRTCLRSCTMALATSSPCDLSAPSTTRDSQSQVLLGLSEKELQQLALDLGQQSYRGKQLHHLIYQRKVREIQDLYQLPRAFRDDLQEAGWRVGRSLIFRNVTAADGTVKLLLKLHDNRLIETVGIPVEGGKGSVRLTACVSSQDVQIGQRLITISTVGVPNTIKKLASHKLQSTLAVSLHAPNQKLRESIVPSAKSYPLDALLRDCKEYFLETSRRISFEYALLAGVNDSVDHAMELAQVLHGWGQGYHVNLIPFNPIEGSEYHRPYKKAVQAFVSTLESLKIAVSVRQTRGLDANAACGQLRNNFQKDPFVTDEDLTLSR